MSDAQDDDWDIVSDVGLTALLTAVGRARATKLPERLVDDPLAEVFVREAGGVFVKEHDSVSLPSYLDGKMVNKTISGTFLQGLAAFMGVRSMFYDRFVESGCAAGARQAVVLGAGLDTRAFRLDWPDGFVIHELDQPKVLAFKHNVLREQRAQPKCIRHAVAADLRHDWQSALVESGLDTSRPIIWLAEGLWPYLPYRSQQNLLATVRNLSSPKSSFALCVGSDNSSTTTAHAVNAQDRPGKDRTPQHKCDLATSLENVGWKVKATDILPTLELDRLRPNSMSDLLKDRQYNIYRCSL